MLVELLGNLRGSDSEIIIARLGSNLDAGLAKSTAMGVIDKLEISLITALFFANATSIMNKTFDEDPQLSGIPKAALIALIDAGSNLAFVQNKYFAPLQWQIAERFITFIAQENSTEVKNGFKDTVSDILVGRANRKQGGEYQLPTIEFSAGFANILVPSVLADYGYYIDYCHEVLGFDRNSSKWGIFYDLITSCGWFFPYEKTVLICTARSISDR